MRSIVRLRQTILTINQIQCRVCISLYEIQRIIGVSPGYIAIVATPLTLITFLVRSLRTSMMTIDNRLADESSPSNVHIYICIYSVFLLLLPSSFLSLPFFVYNTSLYLLCLIPLHILDIYLRDLCPPPSSLLFLRVSVCTSTPYGRSHERDRWNAHRHTHTRARLRAEEPLMNLAVLRPPVCVSP